VYPDDPHHLTPATQTLATEIWNVAKPQTMPLAQEYAQRCNSTYAPSPAGPAQASSMQPNPGPPPTAKIAIITCMDARISPFEMFGLSLGEAHIIRVGGGRAPDALRSLIASQHVLGTQEVMVIHHTDCGFSKAPSEEAVRTEVDLSAGAPVGWLSFMPITQGPEASVKEDVEYLRKSPYIRGEQVSGWVYDTVKGTLDEVQG